jgi:hypothetical protein
MKPSNGYVRSVSWVSVAAIFGCFALFLLLVRLGYLSHSNPPPYAVAPEGSPEELAWKATPEARKDYLADLRRKQQTQATSYAWVDQTKGIVQLPLDRAMELTVQELNAGGKK